jgi:rRNA-processing protein FCF1
MVATVDYELKKRIKKSGGSVLSLANDRVLLEP